MKKKIVSVLLAASMVTGLLAGCGGVGGSGSSDEGDSGSGETVEISFYTTETEKDDPFWESFRKDDAFCEKYGIRCLRREYEGAHTWNVWRKCIKDFLQLLFRQVDG